MFEKIQKNLIEPTWLNIEPSSQFLLVQPLVIRLMDEGHTAVKMELSQSQQPSFNNFLCLGLVSQVESAIRIQQMFIPHCRARPHWNHIHNLSALQRCY